MHILFYSGEFDSWFQPNSFFKKGKLAENFDDDLDQRINTYLFGNEAEETKSFILPISITGNFYDFSGLIFAHHVRLTRNIRYCDVAIVFYGTLELDQLLRLTPLARILLTANVLYVNIAKFSFEDIQKSIEKYKTKQFDINQFTREIQINPPSNYNENHHSIDNEFALIQWSKYVGCFESLPPQIKKEFDSQLYFKYLRVKNPLAEIKNQKEFLIPTISKSKILLIDDEAKKGWENFYSSFLKNFNIEFKDSEIDFKNQEKDKLIELVESMVINYNPDVILLDLRLHDSDFGRDIKPENFTGLEVLENIKKINKGIQVIITTASNKAWNFNLAKQKGAFDFIIKDGFESPEFSINRLTETVGVTANRANVLKKIKKKTDGIRHLININPLLFDKGDIDASSQIENIDKIKNKFRLALDLAFDLLDSGYEVSNKEKYFSYCYLQLFLCIEDFINLDTVFTKGEQCFVNLKDRRSICVLKSINNQTEHAIKFIRSNGKYVIDISRVNNKKSLDTNFIVSSILLFKYGNLNSSVYKWTNIYTIRNEVAHEGYTPTVNQIYDLLDFLQYFLDDSKENDINASKGLTPVTLEESIQSLQQRFNKK